MVAINKVVTVEIKRNEWISICFGGRGKRNYLGLVCYVKEIE